MTHCETSVRDSASTSQRWRVKTAYERTRGLRRVRCFASTIVTSFRRQSIQWNSSSMFHNACCFIAVPTARRSGYPIAVGRPSWPTPTGDFTVTVLERHPTWEVPRSILEESRRAGRIQPPVVPPGPNNPLGDFWIGIEPGRNRHSRDQRAVEHLSHGVARVYPCASRRHRSALRPR